jgi:hypothetical protein
MTSMDHDLLSQIHRLLVLVDVEVPSVFDKYMIRI